MKRRGTIFTYSVIHSSMVSFKDQTPYVVALVEENRGIRLARIKGYTNQIKIKIGMSVIFLEDDENSNPIYVFDN